MTDVTGAIEATEVVMVPFAGEVCGAPQWSELPFFNEWLMVTIDDVPGATGRLVLADAAFVPRTRMVALVRDPQQPQAR